MVIGGKLRERKIDCCSGGRMDFEGVLFWFKKVFKWEDKFRFLWEILFIGYLFFVVKYYEGDLIKYIKIWRCFIIDGEDSIFYFVDMKIY